MRRTGHSRSAPSDSTHTERRRSCRHRVASHLCRRRYDSPGGDAQRHSGGREGRGGRGRRHRSLRRTAACAPGSWSCCSAFPCAWDDWPPAAICFAPALYSTEPYAPAIGAEGSPTKDLGDGIGGGEVAGRDLPDLSHALELSDAEAVEAHQLANLLRLHVTRRGHRAGLLERGRARSVKCPARLALWRFRTPKRSARVPRPWRRKGPIDRDRRHVEAANGQLIREALGSPRRLGQSLGDHPPLELSIELGRPGRMQAGRPVAHEALAKLVVERARDAKLAARLRLRSRAPARSGRDAGGRHSSRYRLPTRRTADGSRTRRASSSTLAPSAGCTSSGASSRSGSSTKGRSARRGCGTSRPGSRSSRSA